MKLFITLLAIAMINLTGCYMGKPILKEIRETKSPKFDELIETDDVFKKYISIGDDERTVLKIIKKNGFDCDVSEKHINTDNEKVYKIYHRFNTQVIPNHLVVVGKLYFKDKKLIFYRTAYLNSVSDKRREYYE